MNFHCIFNESDVILNKHDAEYVTGTVGVTEQQLIDWTGAENITNAINIWGAHGGLYTKSNGKYYIDHTWVKTNIDGKEYELDISFKKYEQIESLKDLVYKYTDDIDISSVKEMSDFNCLVDDLSADMDANENDPVVVSRIKISQKKITKLPLKLFYDCGTIKEEISDIRESEFINSDTVSFTIGGNTAYGYAADFYLQKITIEYIPDPSQKELFELLDLPFPKSTYDLIDANYMIGVRIDAVPAIFINNKLAYYWNVKSKVGSTNDLHIKLNTSGSILEYDKILDVGTINSFVFDTQCISAQQVKTSYERIPSEEELNNENAENIRESTYFRDYLNLMGTMYFSELDIQNKLFASTNDIRTERYLSFGVFSYSPTFTDVEYGCSFEKTGTLDIDIIGNTYSQKSYTGNVEDENTYHFLSGFMSSYLESSIIEQFTAEEGISTAKILSEAQQQGIRITYITSKNIDDVDNLELYDEDKAAIRRAASEGKRVLVPAQNLTINDWTGTGYIIEESDSGDLTFKISGCLNGGTTASLADNEALLKFVTMCHAVAFVDTVMSLYQSIQMMTNAVMTMMFASSTLGMLGGVAMFSLGIVFVNAAYKSYQSTLNACFRALENDPLAAYELFFDAELTLFVNTLSKLGELTSSALKNRIAKKYINEKFSPELSSAISKAYEGCESTAADFIRNAEKAGMDSDAIYYMLRNSGCVNKYSKKILKCISKLDKEVQYIVIDGLEKGGSSLANALNSVKGSVAVDFIECAAKHGDQVFDAVAKSENVEEAVKFIAKYTDDVAEIFAKYGDDVVTAVNNCDAPYKAIQIIKNGGLQYGEQATQAIKKSGDKAVEALTKVPSKECADIILKSSDDVIDAVNKLDVYDVKRFSEIVSEQGDDFLEIYNNCDECLDDAIKYTLKDSDNYPKIIQNANKTGGASRVNDVVRGTSAAEDVLSTGRKVSENSDEWKNISKYYEEQVNLIRENNKGIHKLGNNVSYTEVNINGSKNNIQASSGSKQIDGFADLLGDKDSVVDQQRFFETQYVDSTNTISPSGWNRAVDTEAKTLEQVARDLGSVKNADGTITWGNVSSTGTINIFTENAPCPSCQNVIKQFERAYPGITVNVYWK